MTAGESASGGRSNGIRWSYATLIILSVVVIQAVGFDQTLLFGGRVRIDATLIVVVGLAFVAEGNDALSLAFLTGLLVDLFQFGPFGLHALVYSLAAWLIAVARVRVLQPGTSYQSAQSGAAVLMVTALSWAAGRVFGQAPPTGWDAVWGLLGAGAIGALLGPVAAWVAQRMIEDRPGRRDLEAR